MKSPKNGIQYYCHMLMTCYLFILLLCYLAQVKLSGKHDSADIIWAGKGILAICSGEKYIR